MAALLTENFPNVFPPNFQQYEHHPSQVAESLRNQISDGIPGNVAQQYQPPSSFVTPLNDQTYMQNSGHALQTQGKTVSQSMLVEARQQKQAAVIQPAQQFQHLRSASTSSIRTTASISAPAEQSTFGNTTARNLPVPNAQLQQNPSPRSAQQLASPQISSATFPNLPMIP
jgi:hypothetical protein